MAVPIPIAWKELRISGKLPVRDLWRHRDVGAFDNGYTATVPRHGAVFLKVGRIR